VATVHVLGAVVTQFGTSTLGDTWVGVELVSALLALGVFQLRGVQAFNYHQRGLAGLGIEHRKMIGAQRQRFHRGRYGSGLDRCGGGEQVGATVEGKLFFLVRIKVRHCPGLSAGGEQNKGRQPNSNSA